MNVGFYAAKAQAQIMRHREDHEYAYERYKDTTKFWALIDLVGSSNYRLLKGPDEGKRPDKPRDYLGSPLDQLARILGIRSEDTNLFLHEAAYQAQEAIVAQYSDFLSLSSVQRLSPAESKGMLQPVYYRELHIDRVKLREFRKHFTPWRESK